MIPNFKQFLNETYLDSQPTPNYLKHDFKKMKKNGYITATLLKDVDGLKEGDEVMIASNEFGTLDDDSLLTCFTEKGDEIMVIKSDLKIKE